MKPIGRQLDKDNSQDYNDFEDYKDHHRNNPARKNIEVKNIKSL